MRRCETIQEALSELLDGELSAEQRGVAEAHLRECAECNEAYEMLRFAISAVNNLPPQKAPASVLDAVRAEIRAKSSDASSPKVPPTQLARSFHPRPPVRSWRSGLLSMAAVVVVGVMVFLAVGPFNSSVRLSEKSALDAAPEAGTSMRAPATEPAPPMEAEALIDLERQEKDMDEKGAKAEQEQKPDSASAPLAEPSKAPEEMSVNKGLVPRASSPEVEGQANAKSKKKAAAPVEPLAVKAAATDNRHRAMKPSGGVQPFGDQEEAVAEKAEKSLSAPILKLNEEKGLLARSGAEEKKARTVPAKPSEEAAEDADDEANLKNMLKQGNPATPRHRPLRDDNAVVREEERRKGTENAIAERPEIAATRKEAPAATVGAGEKLDRKDAKDTPAPKVLASKLDATDALQAAESQDNAARMPGPPKSSASPMRAEQDQAAFKRLLNLRDAAPIPMRTHDLENAMRELERLLASSGARFASDALGAVDKFAVAPGCEGLDRGAASGRNMAKANGSGGRLEREKKEDLSARDAIEAPKKLKEVDLAKSAEMAKAALSPAPAAAPSPQQRVHRIVIEVPSERKPEILAALSRLNARWAFADRQTVGGDAGDAVKEDSQQIPADGEVRADGKKERRESKFALNKSADEAALQESHKELPEAKSAQQPRVAEKEAPNAAEGLRSASQDKPASSSERLPGTDRLVIELIEELIAPDLQRAKLNPKAEAEAAEPGAQRE